MAASSLNAEKHPYTRGIKFWETTGAFWRDNPYYSKKSKDYFENWLEEMKQKETRLIRL